jgi:hypothetical protein
MTPKPPPTTFKDWVPLIMLITLIVIIACCVFGRWFLTYYIENNFGW